MAGQASTVPEPHSILIRRATPQDAEPCGRIGYEAFRRITAQHGFPSDFTGPEATIGVLMTMFAHPGFYCVVAERDGRIVGSNCLDERSSIAGVGPITIDPDAQDHGVGRRLMDAVLGRARERNCPGTRLVQAAFHGRSLALYAKLGFVAREPLSVMQGPPIGKSMGECAVRHARFADLEAANRVCFQVHGHDRGGDLANAIRLGTALVVERQTRISGYATALAFYGHAVGETNIDIQALIASAEAFGGPGILVPTRNAKLFRWCLENGLRVVEPMTLMTLGLYSEPAGACLLRLDSKTRDLRLGIRHTGRMFPANRRAALVASPLHLAGFLLIQAVTLYLGIAAQSRPGAGTGIATGHHGIVPLYSMLLVMEWALFYYVWVGLHKRGLGLAAITGGRWRTGWDVARDAAIAIPFWVIWAFAALGVHRILGASTAKTVDSLLPQGIVEGVLWIAVSISAGICEEVAYRGYFQRQMLGLSGSVVFAVAAQAAVFGVAHAYQGWKNVVVIFVLGALYGALAAWRKSLLPGIIAHAWSDVYEGYLKFLL